MPTPTTIIVDQGANQTAQINDSFAGLVYCRLFDEFGNWMAGASVTFQNPTSGPSAAFPFVVYGPYIATTGGDGRAPSGPMVANSTVGAWVGTVFSTAVPSVSATYNMTNSLFPPTPVLTTVQFVSGGSQAAARNTAYQAVVVQCYDQFGAAFPSGSVTMTCPGGTGTFPGGFSSNTVTANGSGVATFAVFTASSTLGNFNPSIAGSGTNTLAADFTTIDPTVVTSLAVYSGNNQSAAPSFPYAQPLVARAANALNNPVAGVAITFTAPGSGASIVWSSPFTNPVSVATDVNGLATTPTFAANANAGTFTVGAIYTGAIRATFFQLTNGGSPPADSSALILCEV